MSCTGDAKAGTIGVERGALVGILAVTERLGQRHVDAESWRKGVGVGSGGLVGKRRGRNLIECVGDRGVVCGGGGVRSSLVFVPGGC